MPAELHVVDAGDALEAMLSIATSRLMRLRERHAVQLDAGDVGLVRLEGEAIDRVARIGKVVLDSGLAERRDRVAQRCADVFAALFERVVAVADVTPEDRRRMVEELVEGIERLENTPAETLDVDGLFPPRVTVP